MLSNVAQSISHSVRQVVLRHPNSMPCAVWRKRVVRVETNPETGLPSEMGGAPTLGGMGVLRSEDEDDYEYDRLGDGRCMFCGVYEQTDQVERDDALLPKIVQEAQVESLAEPGAEGHFLADAGDFVLITPGLSVVIAFEVVTVTGVMNIPPYVRKLVLNPRDDLHALDVVFPEVEEAP